MSKIQLLLTESSEQDALIIAELLDSIPEHEFDITHLFNLKETNQYLKSNEVDIILINLSLPDSYGMHAFDMLFHKYPDIPFLILTDINDDTIGVNAVKKGAQDFLLKSDINSTVLSRSISYSIERKHTEEELRKSDEKYRNLFINSKDAIYMSTIDGDFIDINPAGLALFDYTIDDLESLKVKDLYYHLEDRLKLKKEIQKNGQVTDYELTLKKKDGKTKLNCLLSSTLIYDENQEILGFQGIIQDITARKQAERALMQSLRDLDQANKELLHLNTTLEGKKLKKELLNWYLKKNWLKSIIEKFMKAFNMPNEFRLLYFLHSKD